MGITMIFNVVDMSLPNIGFVTYKERLAQQFEREKQPLTHRQSVAHPHGSQFMVVVAT